MSQLELPAAQCAESTQCPIAYRLNMANVALSCGLQVLSVNTALSIQSHPDKELARKLHAERPKVIINQPTAGRLHCLSDCIFLVASEVLQVRLTSDNTQASEMFCDSLYTIALLLFILLVPS